MPTTTVYLNQKIEKTYFKWRIAFVCVYRPTPSLAEIEESTIQFCGLDWTYLQSKFDVHPYTANEQLSHRCVEGLYLLALLL